MDKKIVDVILIGISVVLLILISVMFWIDYQEAQKQEERRQEAIELWEEHLRLQEEKEQFVREYIKVRNAVLNRTSFSEESREYWWNNGSGRAWG